MRRVFSCLVFLAACHLLASHAASSEPFNNSETLKKVRAEIFELEQKQEQHPFDADLQFILGSNYWTLNHDEKAIGHYQRALILDPEYYAAHWNLSSIYDQQGEGADAVRHMKKAEAVFKKMKDSRSQARAGERLKDLLTKYNLKPQDFEPRRKSFWRIFD